MLVNKTLCYLLLVASVLTNHLSYGLSTTKEDREYLAHIVQTTKWNALVDAADWVSNLPRMTKRNRNKLANSSNVTKIAQKKIENDMQSLVVDAFIRLYNTLPNTLEMRMTVLDFVIRSFKKISCIYDVCKALKADMIKTNIVDGEVEDEFVCKLLFSFQKNADDFTKTHYSPYLLQVCIYLCKTNEESWGESFWLTKIKPFADEYYSHQMYNNWWKRDIQWWEKIV